MDLPVTPFYLLDKETLDRNLSACQEKMHDSFNHGICGYSVKTNSLPWLLKYISHFGYYMEVVSPNEYELVKALGISTNRVIYNGPCKSFETFSEAILNNAIVNIDSSVELEWLTKMEISSIKKIGLRINVDLNELLPLESKYSNISSRFGFDASNDEFKIIIQNIKLLKKFKLAGIHMHCNTKFRSIEAYKKMTKMFCKLIDLYDLDLEYFDIGGGFYGDVENQPGFDDYFKAIKDILNENKKEFINLIVEPGSSLIASPISFHTSVIDTKIVNNLSVAIINGSRNDIDPFFQKNDQLVIYNVADRKKIHYQLICGYTCLESDRILNLLDNYQLKRGDEIIFDKVGAYTMTLTPLFINYFPAVFLKDSHGIRLIRKRWDVNNYLMGSESI